MFVAYFDQFNIIKLLTISYENYIISITNASIMTIGVVIILWFFFKEKRLIPGRFQIIIEQINKNIYGLIKENLGNHGNSYFFFILGLFLFIGILNYISLFPYVFSVTAHIIVTFGLSFSILIGTTLLGIIKFKWNFLSILMPGGAPLILGPALILIETISYLTRAISLGVRLAANLSAGHLLFGILSGFVFNILSMGGVISSIFLMLIILFIVLLEMAVAIIQAYVFCLLTTIYLADTIKLH